MYGLKLKGKYPVLVCPYNVNILVGIVHTVKQNTEALVTCIKVTGLEENAVKTKFKPLFTKLIRS